jgi:hypothetical protein
MPDDWLLVCDAYVRSIVLDWLVLRHSRVDLASRRVLAM